MRARRLPVISCLRPLIAVGALLLAPLAAAIEVPTRIEIRIPAGSNNTAAPGLYVCVPGAGSNCTPSENDLTDDAFLERVEFGSVSFDYARGEITAGLVSVITAGSGVNAEWGDDDDDSDGNDEPFAKSGNPSPPADQESEVPSIRDPAIGRALGDASIVEGIDGEANDYALRMEFQSPIVDDDPGSDASPEVMFFERGINSDARIRLVFDNGAGESTTNFETIVASQLVDSGIDINTLEIGGSQALGVIALDLSDFSGGGFDPAVSEVYAVEFGSAGNGADFFGFFGLSKGLRRDFGDAPDASGGTGTGNYRTRLDDSGPLHLIAATPVNFLGANAPDVDSGTLQNVAATADDLGGVDDEDSLSFVGQPLAGRTLTIGSSATVSAIVNGSGFLNVWVDLNRDGDFLDTVGGQSEQMVLDDDQTGATGARSVDFDLVLPAAATAGASYVRVRFCGFSGACTSPTGAAADGEVEDHRVILQRDDYGDAPDAGPGVGPGDYETLLASNGPRHTFVPGLFIGAAAPDADSGILRDATATADDLDGLPDEGGLSFPDLLAVAVSYDVDVPVTNLTGSDARLHGWIDFDASGSFDEDEAAVVLVPAGTNGGAATLSFTLPDDAVAGDSFVRLRLTTDVLTSDGSGVDERSLGPASDGEVEDRAIAILDLTLDFGDAPDSYGTLQASNGPSHVIDPRLRMGLNIDAEADGQPGTLAEGDDDLGTADEAGVFRFDAISASATGYAVDVRVRNDTGTNATLAAWIDFDLSGTFDADEFASANVPVGNNGDVQVSWAGLGSTIDIAGGLTYVRLRLTTDAIGATDTGGRFSDGEVEDYDLVIFGTEQCTISDPDSGPSEIIPISRFAFDDPDLRIGPDGQIGTVYRYDAITPGVDALVEITDLVNATLGEIDDRDNGGFVDAFQPTVNLTNEPGEGYVEFTITLVKAGTSAMLEPAPVFLASAIDVDGSGGSGTVGLRELVEFYKPFGTVYRSDPTRLQIEDRGSFFRFIPNTVAVQNGVVITELRNIATLRYDGTSEFIYRAGSLNNTTTNFATRLNSLAFGCIEFGNTQTDTVDVDFGDAPAVYPTLLTDRGALHTIVPGLGLGAVVDAEIEGLPDVDARGDDLDGLDGVDDEDAVTVNGQPLDAQRFAALETVDLDVELRGSALLSAWIDWNGDGDWLDPDEQIAADVVGTAAGLTLTVTVPGNAVGGTTYARFRYTTDVGIGPDEGATDGEVEDYALVIARLDFGDAPDAGSGTARDDYTTLESTGGPAHEVATTPVTYLGAVPPDADDGQLQGLDAQTDDGDGVDDEDGVRLGGAPLGDQSLFRQRSYDLQIDVTGPGRLNAWIDLNRDGDFADTVAGVSEHLLDDGDQSANSGTSTVLVPVTIPNGAVVGASYVRVRYCSTADTCDAPDAGVAPDGEIEDYRIVLAPAVADARIAGFVFEDDGSVGGVAHDGLRNGDEIGLAGVDIRLLFDVDADQVCDGTEAVLAQTLTAGDGSYSLRPSPVDAGKAACLVVATPTGYRSISESAGGNPLVAGDPFDDVMTLTVPAAGVVWTDVDFGDVRLPRLSPDRQDTIAPGASVSYLHFYDATTDATVDFALGALSENPPGLDWADALYRDANCDGQVTGAEAGASLTSVSVVTGDRVCLLVRTFAPADAPPDALHARSVDATTTFTGTGIGETASVTDITTVVAGQVRLIKAVRNIGPDGLVDTPDDVDADFESFNGGGPGDVLRYLVRFRNEGTTPVRGLTIIDATPAFTRLEAAAGCPVLPADLSSCTVVTPDGANGPGYSGTVRWEFGGALATGAEGLIEFDVRIEQ